MQTIQNDDLRYIYIGLAKFGRGTILQSDLSPDQIQERIDKGVLKETSFSIHPTNWNGTDDIARIYNLKGYKSNGTISLKKPLTFYGNDYDHGHIYEWGVKIVQLHTIDEIQ